MATRVTTSEHSREPHRLTCKHGLRLQHEADLDSSAANMRCTLDYCLFSCPVNSSRMNLTHSLLANQRRSPLQPLLNIASLHQPNPITLVPSAPRNAPRRSTFPEFEIYASDHSATPRTWSIYEGSARRPTYELIKCYRVSLRV
jgi:hypothetical protein